MEKYFCYFCDELTNAYFISKWNDIYVCDSCDICVPITGIKSGECCVCLEDKSLIKLPNCIHTICLECCKTIYFGTSHNERPTIHRRDDDGEGPEWPFEFDDDDTNDPARIKYNEYEDFESMNFNICSPYDELITIRDSLILSRPEWMNQEMFINYENARFLYHNECFITDHIWNTYNETKLKGNSMCPLCRA